MKEAKPLVFPRLPDWLVYLSIFTAITGVAFSRKEHADAPPPPPPMESMTYPGQQSSSASSPAKPSGRQIATAFSAAADGSWLTVLPEDAGCAPVYLALAERPPILARRTSSNTNDLVLLSTSIGAPGIPRHPDQVLRRGQRGFHLGYHMGQPAEFSSRLLGQVRVWKRHRGDKPQSVLAWAETGRTSGLSGELGGAYGSPILDEAGRIMAVTTGVSPRRGRLYSSSVSATREILALSSDLAQPVHPDAQPLTVENYGRTADDLRRSLQIGQVLCPPLS